MSSVNVLVIRTNHGFWQTMLDVVEGLHGAHLVAETALLADVARLSERHSPDLIISPASIHDESTLPSLKEIRRRRGAGVRFVVIDWTLDNRDEVRGFLALDPAGYFVWQELGSFALGPYLETIMTGATVVGQAVKRLHATASAVGSDLEAELPRITERQREVLRMLATGLTRKEIKEQLAVSAETVQRDIHNLREAFYARTGDEMMFKATCYGLAH